MVHISVELITACFTGLTGLLAASAAFLANRSKSVGEERRVLRRQVRQLQRRLLASMQHLFTLEHELAERGLAVPARPPILELEEDDDLGPAAQAGGSRAS